MVDAIMDRSADPPASGQDASHGDQMGERRVDRFLLRVALRPAAHPKPQAPVGRHRGDRRLRHGLRLRRPDGHPPLGRESPGLAGAVPHAPQRHPLARLHPATADGPQARGVSGVLPGLDRRRDPDRRRRPGPAGRHRRQDVPAVPRRGARPRPAAHRQRLGQRGRDRPGPGRDRGEIQRDHGHPPALEADRADGHLDHDRRHGLSEGDRPRHRRRRRRLRDRRQGQPAEAPGGDRGLLREASGARPGGPQVSSP